MNQEQQVIHPRPAEWARLPRVTFIGHYLLPGYHSSEVCDARLHELGRNFPTENEYPTPMQWLQFPVIPPSGSGGRAVLTEMYIIPAYTPRFIKGVYTGEAWRWTRDVALGAIEEARQDGIEHTLGWGAATKMAVLHGAKFLAKYPNLESYTSTHGDAGTAYMVLEAIEKAGVKPGARFAVIGANGAIGDLVSRALARYEPESIMLIGRPDHKGSQKNLNRLEKLRERVKEVADVQVLLHQHKEYACIEQNSTVVIVATNGDMALLPSEVPQGALVLDITAPAACSPHENWQGRLVLTAGCSEFDPHTLPIQFGKIAGHQHSDVGAGGENVLWGCLAETIAAGIFGRKNHVAGQLIPLQELDWCKEHMPKAGMRTQPPVSFGRTLEWSEVYSFVQRQYGQSH